MLTSGEIGWKASASGGRVENLKARKAVRRALADGDGVNLGQRRRVGRQRAHKFVQPVRETVQLNVHPGGGVAHPAGKRQPLSQAIHKRPKANPLHDAVDVDAPALQFAHAVSALGEGRRAPAQPGNPVVNAFARLAGQGKKGHAAIQDFNTAPEISQIKVDVGQQVGFIED
jgi:hypothetical protein